MKSIFVLIVFFSLSIDVVMAQSYGSSAGLRLGNNNVSRTLGISYKHRIVKKTTIEGIFQTDFNHNTSVHAMVMRHRGILTKRFNFFVGTGLSLGVEQTEIPSPENNATIISYGNTTFGADLILGIEFTLLKHNFSIDYKPNFNIAGRTPWYRGQVGITARSVIITGSQQNKRRRQRQKLRKKQEKEESKNQRLKQGKDGDIDEKPLFQNLFKKKTI